MTLQQKIQIKMQMTWSQQKNVRLYIDKLLALEQLSGQIQLYGIHVGVVEIQWCFSILCCPSESYKQTCIEMRVKMKLKYP